MALNITDVRIYPFDTSEAGGKTLAMADITIDGVLVVKGFRVARSPAGGLFVGFPSSKGRDGAWRDSVIALGKDTRKLVREKIVEAYKTHG